jgi:hypothetical protein
VRDKIGELSLKVPILELTSETGNARLSCDGAGLSKFIAARKLEAI